MTQDEKQHAKEHYGHLLAAQQASPAFFGVVTPPASALGTQIGGDHYKKMAIQPMEYSMANGLDACQHTAIKYITRFRDKGGVEDLRKAMHVIQMLIEFEEKKNG